VKSVCETDVAQWQLQSFSGCICQDQETTQTANPYITATACATRHSSGCIAVCPASFIPVTDPHSTNLTYYLPFPLNINSLRISVLNSSYDSFIGILGFRTVRF
jgi:hypothetical protein